MKRFHVHAHVEDLKASIAFYAALFGAQPTRIESDYAKWMLDDPRINFAISTRSGKYWLTDPQGIAWEQFHTLGDIPVFSETATQTGQIASACCVGIPLAAAPSSCC